MSNFDFETLTTEDMMVIEARARAMRAEATRAFFVSIARGVSSLFRRPKRGERLAQGFMKA